jgi:hypothetical protein
VTLSDLFSRRRKADSVDADGAPVDGPAHPTKAIPKLLRVLAGRQHALLLDLGPVVGPNVTFFGEQLGCKIFVENIFKDVDRHAREGKLAELPAFLARRFAQEDASVDGILCWDLLDYLDKPSAQALTKQLARILKPQGTLLALFASTSVDPAASPEYVKYAVIDETTMQYRPYPGVQRRQKPWLNRDIERVFEPLRVSEQFLLKTNLREVLFRKPAAAAATPDAPAAQTR